MGYFLSRVRRKEAAFVADEAEKIARRAEANEVTCEVESKEKSSS